MPLFTVNINNSAQRKQVEKELGRKLTAAEVSTGKVQAPPGFQGPRTPEGKPLFSVDINNSAQGPDAPEVTAPGPDLRKGGYTGKGKDKTTQKYEPAGVVHEGEYVIPTEVVASLGQDFIDRLDAEITKITGRQPHNADADVDNDSYAVGGSVDGLLDPDPPSPVPGYSDQPSSGSGSGAYSGSAAGSAGSAGPPSVSPTGQVAGQRPPAKLADTRGASVSMSGITHPNPQEENLGQRRTGFDRGGMVSGQGYGQGGFVPQGSGSDPRFTAKSQNYARGGMAKGNEDPFVIQLVPEIERGAQGPDPDLSQQVQEYALGGLVSSLKKGLEGAGGALYDLYAQASGKGQPSKKPMGTGRGPAPKGPAPKPAVANTYAPKPVSNPTEKRNIGPTVQSAGTKKKIWDEVNAEDKAAYGR